MLQYPPGSQVREHDYEQRNASEHNPACRDIKCHLRVLPANKLIQKTLEKPTENY